MRFERVRDCHQDLDRPAVRRAVPCVFAVAAATRRGASAGSKAGELDRARLHVSQRRGAARTASSTTRPWVIPPSGGTLALQKAAPTRELADKPGLERIKAAVLAINAADDAGNPPETGIMERTRAPARWPAISHSGERGDARTRHHWHGEKIGRAHV